MTPEQSQALIAALRRGANLTAAARAARIGRASVYRAMKDKEFADAVADARDVGKDAPPPAALPVGDVDAELTPQAIAALVRAIYRTKRLRSACREVGLDLHPHRITPSSLSRAARRAMRALLVEVERGPDIEELSPADRARRAMDQYLRGEGFPAIDIDPEELRRLSPVVATAYNENRARADLLAEAERAAHDGDE